jgi:hypothetical protein
MTDTGRTIPLMLALTLLGVTMVPGCAKARERWRARLNPPEPEPARMIEPNIEDLSAAEEGLEIIVWTTNDPDHRVGRALREFAESAPPVPTEDAARWARVGLRLVAVPAQDLESLLSACPPVSPLQRQRFGQIPAWTPLVRGPQLPESLIGPDGRPMPGGRPRVIARSWIEPQITENERRDVVRTELGVQIEHARRQNLLTDPGMERTIADEGHVLHALLTTHIGQGRSAMVLVAENPETDWNELPEPAAPPPESATDSPTESSGTDGSVQDPSLPAPPAAASPPRQRTLGEWMLSSPAFPAQDGRPAIPPRKVFIVFLPRVRSVPSVDGSVADLSAPVADPSVNTPRGDR